MQFFVPMMENSENTMDSNDTGIFIISLEKKILTFYPAGFLKFNSSFACYVEVGIPQLDQTCCPASFSWQ